MLVALGLCLACSRRVDAQGGPPYFTTDPETPGSGRWEINLGLIPLVTIGESTTRMPDVDVNFGVGERVQLTFEVAWLREAGNFAPTQYGLSQDALGVKWRFIDNIHGFSVSTFPQALINNPTSSADRGLVAEGQSLILPVEIAQEIGPIAVNVELGYTAVRLGVDEWFTGLVVGHERHVNAGKAVELAGEFFASGDVGGGLTQQTLDAGIRYEIHRTIPIRILAMAGRSIRHARGSFAGYLGIQFLFGPPDPDHR
jgi:hypothetical protein